MPGSPVPEQNDENLWDSGQEFLQKQGGDFSIHGRRLHGYLLTRQQVQCAIEMGALSAGV